LRGVSFGGAMISAKHPNFIVNALGATADDVQHLMALAKSEVKRKFGVILEEEVQIV
jgi:UDP-N-acetylmuramate dehydrogenase